MKLSFLGTALTLTLLTFAGGAQAANPDPTGRTEFGVDISQAGANAADRQKYFQTLSATQQANIRKQCSVIVAQPASHAPEVVAFCNDVNAMPAETTAATAPNSSFSITVPQDAVLSYNLIDRTVYNKGNEKVGEIKDVVLQNNKLIGYILSVGGFLGMGTRYVVVSPEAISISYDPANSKWTALMDASKDQLKSAPEFKYEGKFKR